MEKRQNRILNQSGMQALSPTHGVNIVVSYLQVNPLRDFGEAQLASVCFDDKRFQTVLKWDSFDWRSDDS
jgi:hypothetical protein